VLLLLCWHVSRRRNAKARNFLMLLRQSQLFEVFVRERLEMCATLEGGPELSGERGGEWQEGKELFLVQRPAVCKVMQRKDTDCDGEWHSPQGAA
jgi:hypothetical protein